MAFKDLREFTEDEHLDLPINGKTYRIEEADAQTFVWAQGLTKIMKDVAAGEDVDGAELDDDEEADFFHRLLGDAYEEMLADNIKVGKLKRAAATVLTWIVSDEDTALTVWESGNDPEAVAAALAKTQPNRGSRRASAAAARKTPKPASTSGTRASKSTPRAKPASRGRSSSNSGD